MTEFSWCPLNVVPKVTALLSSPWSWPWEQANHSTVPLWPWELAIQGMAATLSLHLSQARVSPRPLWPQAQGRQLKSLNDPVGALDGLFLGSERQPPLHRTPFPSWGEPQETHSPTPSKETFQCPTISLFICKTCFGALLPCFGICNLFFVS